MTKCLPKHVDVTREDIVQACLSKFPDLPELDARDFARSVDCCDWRGHTHWTRDTSCELHGFDNARTFVDALWAMGEAK